MSARMTGSPPQTSTDDEVESVLAEFGGDARAAIKALLTDLDALLADANRSVSRGFLRGVFSAGARPVPHGDEP